MTDMTAAQMVAERLCAANCLLASGPATEACDCTCEGRWHGVLGSTRVPETAAWRKPDPPAQPGPTLFDLEEAAIC